MCVGHGQRAAEPVVGRVGRHRPGAGGDGVGTGGQLGVDPMFFLVPLDVFADPACVRWRRCEY
jgi:hypothetical protein